MNYNLPVYECALTANEQETALILSQASKEFCKLIGISPKAVGCALEEITEPKHAAWVYQAFNHLKDGCSCIKDLREINERFWSYTLYYNKPILTITLYPLWDVDDVNLSYYMGNVVTLPLNRFLGCFYDSILIEHVDEHYLVESISIPLSQLTGIQIGDPINKIFPSMRSICTDTLFRRCLEKKRPIYFLDVFTRYGVQHHLLIELVPLNHYKPHLFVSIHLLDEKEYFLMMNSVNKPAEQIYQADNIGVAVFEVYDGKFKRIVNTNHCFDRLVYSRDDFAFIYNKIIPLCCTQQSITTIPHRLGNMDCFITAIPTLSVNQLFLFIIPDLETKQSIQKLADRLTKREFEIACRLFNGDSIRGIAIDCGITEGTVKKNLSNIYSKLQVNNRVELVRLIYACK